jgi:hypothetical protein
MTPEEIDTQDLKGVWKTSTGKVAEIESLCTVELWIGRCNGRDVFFSRRGDSLFHEDIGSLETRRRGDENWSIESVENPT